MTANDYLTAIAEALNRYADHADQTWAMKARLGDIRAVVDEAMEAGK